MVGHHHLSPVGDHDLRLRNAGFDQRVDFLHEDRDIEGDAVADHGRRVIVKYAGRKRVKCKPAVGAATEPLILAYRVW